MGKAATQTARAERDSPDAGDRATVAQARPEACEAARDYFVERDGAHFAGVHLLVDLWGARHLDDSGAIERALLDAARDAKATVLNVYLHKFLTGGGISGVLVLAESHISIHTWPEQGFAALDVFMCGDCDAYDAVPALERAFSPSRIQVEERRRGLAP